jgi:hypothetical protein
VKRHGVTSERSQKHLGRFLNLHPGVPYVPWRARMSQNSPTIFIIPSFHSMTTLHIVQLEHTGSKTRLPSPLPAKLALSRAGGARGGRRAGKMNFKRKVSFLNYLFKTKLFSSNPFINNKMTIFFNLLSLKTYEFLRSACAIF